MSVDFDVVVVGAGPAGSSSAGMLARLGLRVALVDRCHFPRPKVCGDGLTPRAIAALERLGVWARLLSHANLVDELHTLDMQTTLRRAGPIPGRLVGSAGTGAVVRRDILDDALRLRAMEEGACFFGGVAVESVSRHGQGSKVVVAKRNGRAWKCSSRVVVLADGAGGRLGATVRGSNATCIEGLALRQYWSLPGVSAAFTICVPLRFSSESCAGYGWVFPVAPTMANVGVGLYGTRDGRALRDSYDSLVARLRTIDPGWRVASPCGIPQGGLLHSGLEPSLMVHDGIVLTGDAAAVTNPFTGEGIAQALESGEVAAEAIAEHFAGGADLARTYETLIRDAFAETTRNTKHLSWIMERGERFVLEFWGAVSPPLGLLGRAARRVSFEERMDTTSYAPQALVEETWARVRLCIEEYPLLVQLVDALRREAQGTIDPPIVAYWSDLADSLHEPLGGIEGVATLLGLITLALVLAADTQVTLQRSPGSETPEEAVWGINCVALGAADILMSQAFARSADLDAPTCAQCGNAMRRAFGALCERSIVAPGGGPESVPSILAVFASEMSAAARACLAKAA